MHIPSSRRPKGFTLMEMLVVIMIIVILAGLSLASYKWVHEMQMEKKAKSQLGLLQGALDDYKKDNGEVPLNPRSDGRDGTSKIFDALFPASTDEKTYCAELDPDHDGQGWLEGEKGQSLKIYDPWGNEFFYRTNDPNGTGSISSNPDYDLWSAGPDGKTQAGADGNYDRNNPDNKDDIRLNW